MVPLLCSISWVSVQKLYLVMVTLTLTPPALISNWWKGKPPGSIACTRKQQPRFKNLYQKLFKSVKSNSFMSYCLETNLGHDDLDPTSSNIKLDLFLMMLHMCSKYCLNLWSLSRVILQKLPNVTNWLLDLTASKLMFYCLFIKPTLMYLVYLAPIDRYTPSNFSTIRYQANNFSVVHGRQPCQRVRGPLFWRGSSQQPEAARWSVAAWRSVPHLPARQTATHI